MAGVLEKVYPPESLRRPKFYRIHEKLGKGSYGKVYRVSSPYEGQEFALKIINLDERDEREKINIIRGIGILASNIHDNIIRYWDSWQTAQDIYIVTEYYQNSDLLTFIQRNGTPSEPQLIEWIRQLALALKHLHKKNIIHRNVKPQNVMVSEELTLKLGDFGTAKQLLSDNMTNTVIGTTFMCPEMLYGEPYSIEVDIYSLGCLCYTLVTGHTSLPGSDRTGINLENLYSEFCSDDFKMLVKQMLSQAPSNRPTAKSILTSRVILENTLPVPSPTLQLIDVYKNQSRRLDQGAKVKIVQKKNKQPIAECKRLTKRSESQNEYLGQQNFFKTDRRIIPDMFTGTHDLSQTCPANMKFHTYESAKTPASQPIEVNPSGKTGKIIIDSSTKVMPIPPEFQNISIEENSPRDSPRCEGEKEVSRHEKLPLDECEIKIQQWVCKKVGVDVYMAAVGCLRESDETTAIELLRNALGEENYNNYFFYFLILLSIYNHSDPNIIKNTLLAMSDHP